MDELFELAFTPIKNFFTKDIQKPLVRFVENDLFKPISKFFEEDVVDPLTSLIDEIEEELEEKNKVNYLYKENS